jgi:DNA-binding IclR family transcriptional regulator
VRRAVALGLEDARVHEFRTHDGDWIAHAENAPERDRYRRALAEVRRRGYSVAVLASRHPDLEAAVADLASSPDPDLARRERSALLDETLHSGYLAADLGAQATVRVAQISAPVFDPEGRVTTSLLVPGPEHEITAAELRALAGRIAEAAAHATRSAGGGAPVQRGRRRRTSDRRRA